MFMRVVLAIAIALVSKMSLSRELTRAEKVAVFSRKQTLKVKSYFEDKIDTVTMDTLAYFRFQALKRSCLGLDLKLKQIERAEKLKDQSAELTLLYRACSEGTLSLAKLFMQQNP